MTKAILSAFSALFSLGCGIISLLSFKAIGADLACILAVIFGFGVVCSICYGIEDTKIADKLANFFAEEGGDDE